MTIRSERTEPATSPPRRLLLVRHGLPDYRGGKRLDEPPGPGLSHIGRVQASQAAAVIGRYEPAAIYSSPLARALQTADFIARGTGLAVTIEVDLKEWHRTEDLYRITQRHARWTRRWLATREKCALVVGHASGLLGILRGALHLSHFGFWRAGRPGLPVLATCDRFEVTMGSVFELVFEPDTVTARCLHHPEPRIMEMRRGRPIERFFRPVHGENTFVRRPNFGALIGYVNT